MPTSWPPKRKGFLWGLPPLVGAAAVGAVGVGSAGQSLGGAQFGWLVFLTSVISMVTVYRHRRPMSTAPFLYVLLFVLFHFGLIIGYGILGPDALLEGSSRDWASLPALASAGQVALFALCALLLGVAAGRIGGIGLDGVRSSAGGELHWIPASGVCVVGFVMLMFVVVEGGGLALLSGTYGEYLEATGGSGLQAYGFMTLGVGLIVLYASRPPGPKIASMLAAFAAVIFVPLGLRGTVLFPLVACFFVLGRRRRISPIWTLAVASGALLLSSAIQQTRSRGVAALWSGEFVARPFNTVFEMGYSIRPLVVVMEWMEAGVEPRYGLTLIAVPLRTLESLVGRPSTSPDYRMFNVEISHGVGAIGGSPVAEGFRNGGLVFALALMFVIGLLVQWIDNLPIDGFHSALGGVILLPLLVSVRNAFTPTLPQLLLGLSLLWFCWRLSQKNGGQSEARKPLR